MLPYRGEREYAYGDVPCDYPKFETAMSRLKIEFVAARHVKELADQGWTTCEFDGRDDSLLQLASIFGSPVAAKSGIPTIQLLTPNQGTPLTRKTFSQVFGTGSFHFTPTRHTGRYPLVLSFLLTWALAMIGQLF